MRKTKVTFAVRPKDFFATGKAVIGKFRATLAGAAKEPIKNRSGFFCFTDLPAGEYAVEMSNKYYDGKTVQIDTTELDPKVPAMDVEFEPSRLYPFPAGTTLILGRVVDKDTDSTVSGAKVKIVGSDQVCFTDETGGFFFYFKEFSDEVDSLNLKVTRDQYKTSNKNYDVIKGVTNIIKIDLTPK